MSKDMSHFLQGGAVLVCEQVCFTYEDKRRSVLNQDGIKVMDRQAVSAKQALYVPLQY